MSLSKYIRNYNTDRSYRLIAFLAIITFYAVLSVFKYSQKDEVLYLRETLLISELIKNGIWFGDYPVGTHGFIFKLPVALIYIFTGPNTYVASIYNSLLTAFSFLIFDSILKNKFKLTFIRRLSASLLLFTNMQLVTSTFLYLREPAELLTCLLFFRALINKKNLWVQGFYLTLMLDAKEHVFFVFAFFYSISLLFRYFQNARLKTFLSNIKHFFISNFKLYIPSILFIFLMHTSSVIPLNIYVSFMLGTIERGFSPQIKQLKSGSNNNNLLETINEEDSRPSTLVKIQKATADTTNKTLPPTIKLIWKYFLKIFQPRTFGFLSVPLIVLIPSIYIMVSLINKTLIQKEWETLSIIFITLGYILVYFLYYSHGRYLIPAFPFIFAYFIAYFDSFTSNRKLFYTSLLVFSIATLYEVTYVNEKIIFNSLIGISFIFYYFYQDTVAFKHKILVPVATLSFVFISTAITYLYSYNLGQIKKSTMWGRDGQLEEVAKLIHTNDRVMFNGYAPLLQYYSYDLSQESESYYKLKSLVPKKSLLKQYNQRSIFETPYKQTCKDVVDAAYSTNTTKILLLKSNTGYSFPYEECVDIYIDDGRDYIKNNFKGKNAYIFYL